MLEIQRNIRAKDITNLIDLGGAGAQSYSLINYNEVRVIYSEKYLHMHLHYFPNQVLGERQLLLFQPLCDLYTGPVQTKTSHQKQKKEKKTISPRCLEMES